MSKLQDWEMELADTYDTPMTPEREKSIKIGGFTFIRDMKKDPEVWLDDDERPEYFEWLKENSE